MPLGANGLNDYYYMMLITGDLFNSDLDELLPEFELK